MTCLVTNGLLSRKTVSRWGGLSVMARKRKNGTVNIRDSSPEYTHSFEAYIPTSPEYTHSFEAYIPTSPDYKPSNLQALQALLRTLMISKWRQSTEVSALKLSQSSV